VDKAVRDSFLSGSFNSLFQAPILFFDGRLFFGREMHICFIPSFFLLHYSGDETVIVAGAV
jgi:hypothetical protein